MDEITWVPHAVENVRLNILTHEYLDRKLRDQAEKIYEIISSLIEWNMSKEEFVKLLME